MTSSPTPDEMAKPRNIIQDYAVATGVGALFGVTNTLVGHPFDTLKTKMQAQSGYGNTGILQSCRMIYSTSGLVGFYHGCVPPLLGSAVYRSAQFAVYETVHEQTETVLVLRQKVMPIYSDMEVRVLLAGISGASARTMLESPIEYAKVQGQTGQKWRIADIYRGATLQWLRTAPMMTFWFCAMDVSKRRGWLSSPQGAFLCSGGWALVGFWIVWPFETLKNQAQAGIGGSVFEKMRRVGGLAGLYRGIGPGSVSVFLRNGAAMVVMRKANQMLAECGLKR